MIVPRVLGGIVLAGLILAAPAAAQTASPAPGTSAAPVTAPDPDRQLPPPIATAPSPEVAARARAEFEANKVGKIDRTRYTPEMNARITESALAEASAALRALGTIKGFTQVRKITNGSLTLYVFRVDCEKPPPIDFAIGWDAAGRVDFLQFRPVS